MQLRARSFTRVDSKIYVRVEIKRVRSSVVMKEGAEGEGSAFAKREGPGRNLKKRSAEMRIDCSTPLKIMDRLSELPSAGTCMIAASRLGHRCIADGIAAAEAPRNCHEGLFVTVPPPYRPGRRDPFGRPLSAIIC